MDESVGHQLADGELGVHLDVFAEGVCEQLVARDLVVDIRHEVLEPGR
jgi:hypothetical protein